MILKGIGKREALYDDMTVVGKGKYK